MIVFGCNEDRFEELVRKNLKGTSKYQFQIVDDAPMICAIGKLIAQAIIPNEVIEEIKVEELENKVSKKQKEGEDSNFICSLCGKKFDNGKKRSRHNYKVHNEQGREAMRRSNDKSNAKRKA